MKKKEEHNFVCPHCGAALAAHARSCPECGSDERTGWSDQIYLDGLNLPDSDDYDEIKKKEFENSSAHSPLIRGGWQAMTAIVLLILFLLLTLRPGC